MNKKQNVVVAGIILCTLLFAAAGNAQEQGTAAALPRIVFSEIRFDAGTVKEGAIVNHDFEFTNEGQAALRIRDVIPA